MTRPHLADLEQVDRDELAEARRERDRQREPGALRHQAPDLTARRAFQAGVIDGVNVALDTATIELVCPACESSVYAPGDSDHERVDCLACDARLVTRRGIDGVSLVLADGGTP